jgi:hypothetical protein
MQLALTGGRIAVITVRSAWHPGAALCLVEARLLLVSSGRCVTGAAFGERLEVDVMQTKRRP